MIKINKTFPKKFIEEYIQFALDTVLWPNIFNFLKSVPHTHHKLMSTIFNKCLLETLLRSKPESFENIIKRLYRFLPFLAERYCYSYLLDEINISKNIISLDLTSLAGRQSLENIIALTCIELRKLTTKYSLYLTPSIISGLESNISLYKKKKILCRLENAKRGGSQITEKDQALFPNWVNEFAKCFDYDRIAKKFGQSITELLDLTVCPYCALESIQTYSTISVRPDLDHFYPKTRFPFLAISLYNLIPAGTVCNQKHKRNNTMLGHMHPYLEGLEHENMFRFGFLPDGNIRTTFRIDILTQSTQSKNKNIDLFKVKGLYNENEDLREWFFNTYELREFLKAEGQELSLIDFLSPRNKHVVDINRPNTKVSGQKFKVEALNDLFGQNLNIVAQPE